MIKKVLMSGLLASSFACVIIDRGPLTIDTLSPGVVEHYYGGEEKVLEGVEIEPQLEMPYPVTMLDTSYKSELRAEFEKVWEEERSIYLVDVIKIENRTSEIDSLGIRSYFREVYYRAVEYSWKGEEVGITNYKDTLSNSISSNCGEYQVKVTESPLIYWDNDFNNDSIYNHSKGFSTFKEDGQVRIERKHTQPYVSLSLDSSFALHRGEISPINNSSTIGNTHYLGYDSKGVLLGQFTQEEKKAFELESPVEKVFFKRK